MKPSTRFAVLKRDGFTCQYCGKAGGQLEVDHVVPKSRGGSDEPSNLKTACFDCNRGKSDTPLGLLTKKKRTAKYAFHIIPGGGVDYLGLIVGMDESVIQIEAINAIDAHFGFWNLSGAVYECPRSECRLFTKKLAAMQAMHAINEEKYMTKKRGPWPTREELEDQFGDGPDTRKGGNP